MSRSGVLFNLDQAARRLGLSAEEVRQLGESGALAVEKRNGQWAISAETLASAARTGITVPSTGRGLLTKSGDMNADDEPSSFDAESLLDDIEDDSIESISLNRSEVLPSSDGDAEDLVALTRDLLAREPQLEAVETVRHDDDEPTELVEDSDIADILSGRFDEDLSEPTEDSESLEFPADGAEWTDADQAVEGELLDDGVVAVLPSDETEFPDDSVLDELAGPLSTFASDDAHPIISSAAAKGVQDDPNSALCPDADEISALGPTSAVRTRFSDSFQSSNIGDTRVISGGMSYQRSPLVDDEPAANAGGAPTAREMASEMLGADFDFPDIELDVPGASFIIQGKPKKSDSPSPRNGQPAVPSREVATPAHVSQPPATPPSSTDRPSPLNGQTPPSPARSPLNPSFPAMVQQLRTDDQDILDLNASASVLAEETDALPQHDASWQVADVCDQSGIYSDSFVIGPGTRDADTLSALDAWTGSDDDVVAMAQGMSERNSVIVAGARRSDASSVSDATPRSQALRSPEGERPRLAAKSTPRRSYDESDILTHLPDPVEAAGTSSAARRRQNNAVPASVRRRSEAARQRLQAESASRPAANPQPARGRRTRPYEDSPIVMRSTAPSMAFTVSDICSIWCGCLLLAAAVFLVFRFFG